MEGTSEVKRQTVQRKTIEGIFRESISPLGVEEILVLGQKQVSTLNRATVYRNLKLLLRDGLIQKIVHPKLGILYERTGKAHHHYFQCRSCNQAFELPGCVINARAGIPEGFVVEDHEVFLFGICPSCSVS